MAFRAVLYDFHRVSYLLAPWWHYVFVHHEIRLLLAKARQHLELLVLWLMSQEAACPRLSKNILMLKSVKGHWMSHPWSEGYHLRVARMAPSWYTLIPYREVSVRLWPDQSLNIGFTLSQILCFNSCPPCSFYRTLSLLPQKRCEYFIKLSDLTLSSNDTICVALSHELM